MLKWTLIVIAIIAGFVVLVYIIGLFLPRNHVASRTVTLGASQQRVWDAITDFESQPDWRGGLKAMNQLEDRDGRAVWQEIHNRGDRLSMMLIEIDQPTRLRAEIVDQSAWGGTWTWQLEPAADGHGTTITITEDGFVSNPMFRVMAKLFMDEHATMDKYLADLRLHLDKPVGD